MFQSSEIMTGFRRYEGYNVELDFSAKPFGFQNAGVSVLWGLIIEKRFGTANLAA